LRAGRERNPSPRRRETPKETTAAIYAEIATLKSRLPGVLAAHIGNNVSPETGMDKGHSEGFVVDFDGPEARDAYLADAYTGRPAPGSSTTPSTASTAFWSMTSR
jgi:hypothetical protein